MRRILLMLAAKDQTPLNLPKPRRSKPRPKPAVEDESPQCRYLRPDALSGRFAFEPRPPTINTKPRKRSKPDPDKIYVSAFGVASRLEALIRIFEDPHAAAKCLRKKIARHKLKHELCARMMAEPLHLLQDHPFFITPLKDMEEDTLAASGVLVKPSG